MSLHAQPAGSSEDQSVNKSVSIKEKNAYCSDRRCIFIVCPYNCYKIGEFADGKTSEREHWKRNPQAPIWIRMLLAAVRPGSQSRSVMSKQQHGLRCRASSQFF